MSLTVLFFNFPDCFRRFAWATNERKLCCRIGFSNFNSLNFHQIEITNHRGLIQPSDSRHMFLFCTFNDLHSYLCLKRSPVSKDLA